MKGLIDFRVMPFLAMPFLAMPFLAMPFLAMPFLAIAFFAVSLFVSTPAVSENFFPYPHEEKKASPVKYEKHNIDQVISSGQDEELVMLSGEIIKKLKCSTYLFRDETGEIHIQIDNQDIPVKGLIFGSSTIIKGEVVKDEAANGKVPVTSIETERIQYTF